MKLLLLTIFILFSFQSFSQEWNLNAVNKSGKYKYEYWFQFQNENDTSSYKLNIKEGNENSTFEFLDNQGNPLDHLSILITSSENEVSTRWFADENGKINTLLENGKYSVRARALAYDDFKLEFEIGNDQFVEINVNVGLGRELTVYQINSKDKLNESEISEIMDCVKNNRVEFFKSCSNKKRYLISMQI